MYYGTKTSHKLTTGNANKINVIVKKKNFPDTVVWNPWTEKAKAMGDFGDEEFNKMICVEAGCVQNRYVLKSNENVVMGQEIIVERE